MSHSVSHSVSDYTPVRINMLENAVENIGILEKSGVSDYTPFGMSMPERSWSLPDACNTYTSYYYDKPLDIDCFIDCGTWTTFGSGTYLNCNTSSGYLQIGIYGNYRGAYTEFDTETDSTYVVDINITGYNTMATWQVSARDNQGNIIASSMVSQTGPMSFEFTATGSLSRVYVMRVTSYYTFASIALSAVSVTGKYHKEDVMYLSYRYGFNSQEKDDEIYGTGNSYTAEYWQYDARLGRRWNVDPRPNTSSSVYSCFLSNPIVFMDVKGDTIKFAEGTRFLFKIQFNYDLLMLQIKSPAARKEIKAIKKDKNILTVKEMGKTNAVVLGTAMIYPETFFKRMDEAPEMPHGSFNEEEWNEWKTEYEIFEKDAKENYRPHLSPPGDDAYLEVSYSKDSRKYLKGEGSNFRVRTAHDLRHAFNIMYGRVNSKKHYNTEKFPSSEEEDAVSFENTIIGDLNRFRLKKLKNRDIY